ncbi:MAG: hypothetical protein KIS76_01090 [Pyrinomonadaceae bacterium]|nr:hypothetical protein [Pyrinomonadaceae bacterium]
MNKLLIAVVCLLSAFSAFAQTPAKSTQNLPIRRVILYSNGVSYIERRGFVNGNAEIDLSFKQSQVDDVLKSIIVLDLGRGRIGAVSYNSSAPPSAKMAEIPFSVAPETTGTGGISGVLAQLQGARVSLATASGTVSGSILTVEKRAVRDEKTERTATFLVIASDGGEISNYDLADVRSVKLLDEGTKRDINEFATASASTRRRDAKTITVTSEGSGQREMIVSYTIAAPIWKTTYRVVLDDAGKPFFQGWAIVDNVSDEDWENVQLSLVSGTPISFILPLQKPLYRYRPVVPTPRELQLQPQVYEPTIDTTDSKIDTNISKQTINELPKGTTFNSLLKSAPNVRPESLAGGFQIDGASGSENTFLVDGQEISNFRTGQLNSNNYIPERQTTVSEALTSDNSGVRTAATGGEIGDLFEYKIDQPVTVMRDRSALIPIVQTTMEGERVSVYNQSVRIDRPMSGLRLNNITNLTLESGSITVIDGNAYAGESLMERLKAKEERLISFALDLGTHVRVRQDQNREPAKLIKVVNGVFQVHYFRTDERTYQISNQTNKPKVLYIEYPIRDGWELTEKTEKPDYTTQRYYRFRIELKPLENKDFLVSERQGLMDNYQLTSLSKTDLSLFVSRKYIDDKTKQRLEKLIDIRTRLAEIDGKLASFDQEIEKIGEDQERLRENIEALSKTSEAKSLIARYIEKVNRQETRLEEIEKERQSIAAERTRLSAELAAEIRNFEIA